MSRNYSATAVETALSSGITSSATSISVAATTGFPLPPFILAVDAGAATQEVVLVTAMVGTTLTVERGYDSTAAQAHDAGAVVRHAHSAVDFRDARNHESSPTGVHGLSGNVAGVSDTQALTNKTMLLSLNTIQGTVAEFNAALQGDNFVTLTGTETLTNKTLTSPTLSNPTITGGAWTSYDPAVSGATVAPEQAYYKQVGKTVFVSYRGTITAASGVFSVPVPVAAARVPVSPLCVGTAFAHDSGTAYYTAAVLLDAEADAFNFATSGTTSLWIPTVPHAWASGDTFSFTAVYEAA